METLPPSGLHFVQVQVPNGLFSNDFIFHVADNAEKADELRRSIDPESSRSALAAAISRGDLKATKRLVEKGAELNARRREGGMTPLSTAAFHGRLKIAKYLIEKGARVSRGNADGNTPLHLAAFVCRDEMVKYLLEKGASLTKKSRRNETAIDVVSSPWSEQLAEFYTGVSNGANLNLDITEIEKKRPVIAKLLRDHAEKSKSKDKKIQKNQGKSK